MVSPISSLLRGEYFLHSSFSIPSSVALLLFKISLISTTITCLQDLHFAHFLYSDSSPVTLLVISIFCTVPHELQNASIFFILAITNSLLIQVTNLRLTSRRVKFFEDSKSTSFRMFCLFLKISLHQ